MHSTQVKIKLLTEVVITARFKKIFFQFQIPLYL